MSGAAEFLGVRFPLKNNKLEVIGHFLVDAEDWKVVSTIKWRAHSAGYVVSGAVRSGDYFYLHRFLIPGARCVDHINGDRRDNRRSNLRACTHQENMRNHADPFGDNPHVGVSRKRNNKWRSYITVSQKQIPLGVFDSLTDAIASRREAERKYFGEFAPQRVELCSA